MVAEALPCVTTSALNLASNPPQMGLSGGETAANGMLALSRVYRVWPRSSIYLHWFHDSSEKLRSHCWYDAVSKGFKLVHPTGTPIIHSTKLGFSLFGEGWGKVWSFSEDSLPCMGITWAWRPNWDCSATYIN